MRETEILVEQQPPQGVLVCDHAGLVINKFSLLAQVLSGRVAELLGTERSIEERLMRRLLLTPLDAYSSCPPKARKNP